VRSLILGINGFLGGSIARSLAEKGHEVIGLSRSAGPGCEFPGTYVSADRLSPDSILEVVEKHNITAVVDILAMSLSNTGPLLSRLDGNVEQYVMLSSCDVYRNYELIHRLSKGSGIDGGLNENSSLRRTRYPYRTNPRRSTDDPSRPLDDYDKIPIESRVSQLETPWTILRLPMIYGPGDKQRRFRWAIEHMARSNDPLDVPRRWANWTTTYGYLDNIATAVALTVGNSAAFSGTFNVGEAAPVDHLTWSRRLSEAMDWKGEILVSDDQSGVFARSLEALDLTVPLEIDSAKIREQLGFRECVSIAEGLRRTIADELAREGST